MTCRPTTKREGEKGIDVKSDRRTCTEKYIYQWYFRTTSCNAHHQIQTILEQLVGNLHKLEHALIPHKLQEVKSDLQLSLGHIFIVRTSLKWTWVLQIEDRSKVWELMLTVTTHRSPTLPAMSCLWEGDVPCIPSYNPAEKCNKEGCVQDEEVKGNWNKRMHSILWLRLGLFNKRLIQIKSTPLQTIKHWAAAHLQKINWNSQVQLNKTVSEIYMP